MQKLYVYVDESGQDPTSQHFIVVAVVVSAEDRIAMQDVLMTIEDRERTGRRKWNHMQNERRLQYLNFILSRRVGRGRVFFGIYRKPIPYFFPTVEIIAYTIAKSGSESIQARVYVDGLNQTVAHAISNAVRARGVPIRVPKGLRDESEPIIRLADMWAGCIRHALLEKKDAQEIFQHALKEDYLIDIRK